MNEPSKLPALNDIKERVSKLEKEVSELRQLIHLQKTQLAKPIDTPSLFPTNSVSPSLVTSENDCWEVTCLGDFRLRYFGNELALCKSRRGQSILKYLLASPGYSASPDTLIECFWPHVDSDAGAHSLQVAIHALRCSLRGCGPNGSDETVLFGKNRYLLNPSLTIVQDVDLFRAAYERGLHAVIIRQFTEAIQALEEARALYTGNYHADCYEDWASSRRLALIDTKLALLSQLGHLYSQEREWELAVSCYHDILVVDCYREDIYRQLMCCYSLWGRRADVKRTYRTCQERLRHDLRLAPAPETTMLYQQLIQPKISMDTN